MGSTEKAAVPLSVVHLRCEAQIQIQAAIAQTRHQGNAKANTFLIGEGAEIISDIIQIIALTAHWLWLIGQRSSRHTPRWRPSNYAKSASYGCRCETQAVCFA